MISFPNPWEIGILIVVVLLVVGPERLPTFAAQLGRLVRELRDIARGATERVREEMGDSFDDLRDLDPRQYDPRRIVREALMEDVAPRRPPRAPRTATPPTSGAAAATAAAAAGGAAAARPRPSAPTGTGGTSASGAAPADGAPFDDEAT
ncbi:twin-arginine translocase TatA/TatE family subunit [Litorihabitans aurantiacus]|uniref:twin-arginine translocase TatA/TatE family subunit n=1 Tax=Litorihabitans aurantiacus TaxID=1930061 RepID=UPI0024E0A9AE|nr:twin-arginine translocase TatA/TatE family subunit [Litorihabitans aurantiacus]